MDKQTCSLEIQKYAYLINTKMTHIRGSNSIEILSLSCQETELNNYFISVQIRHILTGSIEDTSIGFIQANYS